MVLSRPVFLHPFFISVLFPAYKQPYQHFVSQILPIHESLIAQICCIAIYAWKVCLCWSHFGKTAGMVGKTNALLLMLFLMLGHMPVVIQENKSRSTVSPEALAWNSHIPISTTFYCTGHAKPRDFSSIKKWGNRPHTALVEESQCIYLCFQPTINIYN